MPQRCIYCVEEKDLSAFNRDHILPEALGAFRDNLPRLSCVCGTCNQHFGDYVEVIFHRGSIEAIYRILYDALVLIVNCDAKPIEKANDRNRGRTRMALR